MTLYRPLDRAKKEVRLIRLVDGYPPPEATWMLEMKYASLKSEEVSQASSLSYVWGKYDNNAKYVSINGILLQITANLHSAIACIAGQDGLRQSWYWIDAICINQEDVEERGFQVRLMKELYSRAGRTIAYLGSADDDTPRGLAWLIRLDAVRRTEGQNLKWLSKAARDPIYEEDWKAMDAVFQKEWWVRAWILQESVVSPTLVFLCGDQLVEEPTIWSALHFLLLSQRSTQNSLVRLRIEMNGGGSLTFQRIYGRLILRTIYQTKKEIPLYDLLESRGDFFATDPRDYVYGLFALAESSSLVTAEPDYMTEVWEVYATFMMTWIKSRNNLDILTLGGWPRGNDDFPSWVADLGCKNEPGSVYNSPDCIWLMNLRLQALYEVQVKKLEADRSIDVPEPDKAWFRACGSTAPQFMRLDSRTIECRGICIDTIDGIASTEGLLNSLPEDHTGLFSRRGPSIANHQPKGKKSAYGNAEKTKDAIWRTLVMDRCEHKMTQPVVRSAGAMLYGESMEVENSKGDFAWRLLWEIIREFEIGGKTLFEWFKEDLSDVRLKAFDALREYHQSLSEEGELTASRNPMICRATHIMAEMQRHLFISDKGYIGLVTTNAMPGDEVWVLLSCNIPLVMRKKDDGTRILVGECYVHGIMYGEAVKDIEAGQRELISCIIN